MNSALSGDIFQRVLLTQGDPALCASFHLVEEAGKWIQYGDDRINAAYPWGQDPTVLVALLGGELESWEAHKYVTVVVVEAEAKSVVRWIDTYFRWVLASRDKVVSCKLSRFERCLSQR